MSSWGVRLGTRTRWLVEGVCWVAILSGLLWIGLGWGMDPDDFTSPLRGWRHQLLVLHSTAAYVLLWVTGSLLTLHQMGNWRARGATEAAASLWPLHCCCSRSAV